MKTALAIVLMACAIAVWAPKIPALLKPAAAPRRVSAPIATKNEQTWMNGEIGRQITEMVAFSKGAQAGRTLRFESGAVFGNRFRFRLSASFKNGPEVKIDLENGEYFWAPEMFVPWVKALTAAWHVDLRPITPRVDDEYLSRLTTPRPEILIQEDLRLSEALTKDPLSVKTHEEAALLIGSLALREATLKFMDTRPALNAMSAHLALAKAGTRELSACGQLAEAVLCSLAGRQADAVAIVDLLQKRAGGPNEISPETATRWASALKMYNSGDYRLFYRSDNPSLLEQLEYFRALRYRVNSEAASAFAEENQLERLAEWSARVMAGPTSVSDGHLWSSRALEAELDESAAAFRAYHAQPLDHDHVVKALNTPWEPVARAGAGKTKLPVLGWGAWAQFYQREICESIEAKFYFLGHMLGMPEEAQTFKDEITKRFADLKLFPLVSFDLCERGQVAPAITDGLRNLFAKSPSEITYDRWNMLFQPMLRCASTSPDIKLLAPMQAWFGDGALPGTTYDFVHRANHMLGRRGNELEKLKALAPYNLSIVSTHLYRTTNYHPTSEQTAAQFNYLSGYDLAAMKTMAASVQDQPKRYAEAFVRICQIDANRYTELGNYLRDHDDAEGAARAYQNAFDHAPDRVHVSNTSEWLVNYYYDHGRKEEAFRIAREAADVYSSSGLRTLAALFERTGDLEQAEEYYGKIDQRYESQMERASFYLRHQSESPRYAAALKEVSAKVFPNGIESVDLNSLTSAPTNGVIVTTTSGVMQRIGMYPDDVLVAIDGRRIGNMKQYYFIRDASKDPNISYLVWRSGQYLEIKGNIPDRRIQGKIEDYLSH